MTGQTPPGAVLTWDGKRTLTAVPAPDRTHVLLERDCPNDLLPGITVDRLDYHAALDLAADLLAAAYQLDPTDLHFQEIDR